MAGTMKQPRRKAVVLEAGSITELLTAFRIRKAELGLNMTKIDALAGFEFGYAGKLFSRPDSKAHRRLTDFSLPRLLDALECKLVLVPSDESRAYERLKAIADMMRSGAPHGEQAVTITEQKVADAQKNIVDSMKHIGASGGCKRWARLSAKNRTKAMRELAEKRWANTKTERKRKARSENAKRAAAIRWAKVNTDRAAHIPQETPGTPATCRKRPSTSQGE